MMAIEMGNSGWPLPARCSTDWKNWLIEDANMPNIINAIARSRP